MSWFWPLKNKPSQRLSTQPRASEEERIFRDFFVKQPFISVLKRYWLFLFFWLWRLQFVTKVTNASIIEMGFELEKKRKEKMVAAFFWALSKQQLHNFFLNRNFFSVPCSGGSSSVERTSGQKKFAEKKYFSVTTRKKKYSFRKRRNIFFFVKTVKLRKFIFHCSHRLLNFFCRKWRWCVFRLDFDLSHCHKWSADCNQELQLQLQDRKELVQKSCLKK